MSEWCPWGVFESKFAHLSRYNSVVAINDHLFYKPIMKKLTFRTHAVERMFQRNIDVNDVRSALETGEVIEAYPDDLPYPSYLLLGRSENRPLHIVAADVDYSETIIITVYEPNPNLWSADLKRRRS